MGEKTGIAWTDHTFNPWIGCTKVSPGCQNCYAARDNNRYKWVGEWGKDYRLTSAANWSKPIDWAKNAVAAGVTRRVFCASLADVFDEKVDWQWRAKLFSLIQETEVIGGLEWLILTKRPERINLMHRIESFTNIRLGFTAENQEMLDKRAPVFFQNWQGKNFISIEPMLSRINLGPECFVSLDWVIAGCESGPNARECDWQWIHFLKNQCHRFEIPFFLKQMMVEGRLTKTPMLEGKQWLEFPHD